MLSSEHACSLIQSYHSQPNLRLCPFKLTYDMLLAANCMKWVA
jgi:hypothetical protein